MLEQTEIVGIVRDVQTGALLNKNNEALVAYKKKKAASKMLDTLKESNEKLEAKQTQLETDLKKMKIDSLIERINNLENLLGRMLNDASNIKN